MAIIPAKCTQCGANIQVDNTKDAGICESCGTAFITEKVINNYNTFVTNNYSVTNVNVVTGNAVNYLELAKNALAIKKGAEAIDYANKALELDVKSASAWLVKMKAFNYTGTVKNPQVSEAILCGNNAIKYSSNNSQIIDEVYRYYLERAKTLMSIAEKNIKDVEALKREWSKVISRGEIERIQRKDNDVRTMYLALTVGAINFKLNISENYIANNVYFQNEIVSLAKQYLSICQSDVERLKIYGMMLTEDSLDAKSKNLQHLKKGLPPDKISQINDDAVMIKNKKGCYVATCVYGSYDCPQVWALRRYRDNTLASTWYGRAFIRTYYALSPAIVKWFGNNQWFKNLWKNILDKMVSNLRTNGVEDTPYQDKEWR